MREWVRQHERVLFQAGALSVGIAVMLVFGWVTGWK